MQAENRKQACPENCQILKPQTFFLANGLKVMVVENHKLPRVTFNLTIDNPPFAEHSKK
jgi:predicted Zn-dependent peptidase